MAEAQLGRQCCQDP